MAEYAISRGNGSMRTVKARRMADIPSGRQALADMRQREADLFNIDRLPGGNTPNNVKIMAERLKKLEMELSRAIPAQNDAEWRQNDE